MVGYVCKYTPYLVIESFGEKAERIEPEVNNYEIANSLTHSNICSYAKLVLEDIIRREIDKVILTNCCDSIRRLYDILETLSFIRFLHIIDLPRKRDQRGRLLFKNEIIRLINRYEDFSGKGFDRIKFRSLLNSMTSSVERRYKDLNIVLIGSRCKDSLIKSVEESGGSILYNLTCTGSKPQYRPIGLTEDPIEAYANILLDSYPCIRMDDIKERLDIITGEKRIDGVIYHTVKFCDLYSYEYADIKDKINIPLLKVETDYTDTSEGQMRTRIQAFIEALRGRNNREKEFKNAKKKLIVAGIDSGSTSTNVVILDSDRKILGYSILPTGAKSLESAYKALEEALKMAKINIEDLSYIVATGYGRISISFANLEVTEITCHAKGAFFLNREIRTVIDIGGQDSKIIKIDRDGNVIDFVMNDKCSAGTGRFLENMSRVLEIPVERMGEESLDWKEDLEISSMCTVFAESEVISLIAKNKDRRDILHALNKSIVRRIVSFIERIEGESRYMMTGGVAKNIGVVRCLEERLGEKVIVPDEPQIVGALGSALIGLERLEG
ncbi:MAG: acyl-CoA dehydratase activase [bacterium]|nr:acyl-CoA dehydratase activase [bacterium]